ncbi:hypothetical protein [Streptomyces sp. NPDC002164]|uniref:hypothetical protein n=1 Tax=Streptomyces sp. NPDC002164 TaxID=3364633 RepID=UPI0036C4D694
MCAWTGVFELFPLNSIETMLRVPLPWLGVLVDYKKPGKPSELIFGVVRDPHAALHGTDRAAFGYRYTQAVRVPHSDESRARRQPNAAGPWASRSTTAPRTPP